MALTSTMAPTSTMALTRQPWTRWMVGTLGVVGLLFATMGSAHASESEDLPQAMQEAIRAYLLGLTEHMPPALALPAEEEIEEEVIEEEEIIVEEGGKGGTIIVKKVVKPSKGGANGVFVIKKDGDGKPLHIENVPHGWIQIQPGAHAKDAKRLRIELGDGETKSDAWGNIIHQFLESNVLKDVEITIKLPDGTSHTIGGKQGKAGKRGKAGKAGKDGMRVLHGTAMPHLESGTFMLGTNDFVKAGKVFTGFDAGAAKKLMHRLERLEQHNRRLQHELDVMRRRFNESLRTRAGHDRAERAEQDRESSRHRREDKDRGGNHVARIDKRLAHIEHMLVRMLESPGRRAALRAEAPKQAKAVRKVKPTDAEFLLRQARDRVEALMKKLERQRDELESAARK